MARDGLSMKLEGGAKLDRVLAKMAITHQSKTSSLVYSALGSGATTAKKTAKAAAPVDTGTLKKSLISGLRRRVPTPRDVFLSAVAFDFTRVKDENEGTGGWYSIFNIRRHKENAFGNRGGKDFVKKAIKTAEPKVRKTIGTRLAIKIAKAQQQQINKL